MSLSTTAGHCLICYKNRNTNNNFQFVFDEDFVEKEECELLIAQTNVIFILRRILEVPKSFCEKLVKTRGNPSEWFPCCLDCKVMIQKALGIFKKMMLLKKEFRRIQKKIQLMLQTSKISNNPAAEKKRKRGRRNEADKNRSTKKSVDEIRSFIFNDRHLQQQNYLPFLADKKNNVTLQVDDEITVKEEIDSLDFIGHHDESLETDWINDGNNREFEFEVHSDYKLMETENFGDIKLSIMKKEEIGDKNATKDNARKRKPKDNSQTEKDTESESEYENDSSSGEDYGDSDWEPIENGDENVSRKNPPRGKGDINISTSETDSEAEFKIKCIQCGQLFKKIFPHFYNQHLQSDSSTFCEKCREDCVSVLQFQQHVEEKHPEVFSKFEVKYIKLVNELKQKSPSELKEISYKCDFCDTTCKKVWLLKEHEMKHAGIRLYKCDMCEKYFSTARTLKDHLSIHTGEKPYKCKTCGHSFRQLVELKKHQIRHISGWNGFQCKLCGKSYVTSNRLRVHMRNAHLKIPKAKFTCEICGKMMLMNNKLHHLRIHAGEKPHKCNICGKDFSLSSSLTLHSQVHSNEKPCICDQCGKRFASLYSLKQHIQIHTGHRPYKCDQCDKSFTIAKNLSHHKRIHGDSKFFCHICGKGFYTNAHMQRHLLTHTDKLPFQCNLCDKRCRRNCQLKAHKLRIHKITT